MGNYLVVSGSAVLVERKIAGDFLSSIRSNRLWDQLLRTIKVENLLGYEVKRRILLLQGSFQGYRQRAGVLKEEMLKCWSQPMGAFLEIVYVYSTPIFLAENDTALKAFFRILGQRECAGKNNKNPESRWYMKPVKADLPRKDWKRYILSALPYIGNQLAQNLLSHFETISGAACASVEELQRVPKIGKKKADLIIVWSTKVSRLVCRVVSHELTSV